jgi:hypothetical protein
MIVDNVPAIVFKVYANWDIEFINNKSEDMLGYANIEFGANRLTWKDLIL